MTLWPVKYKRNLNYGVYFEEDDAYCFAHFGR